MSNGSGWWKIVGEDVFVARGGSRIGKSWIGMDAMPITVAALKGFFEIKQRLVYFVHGAVKCG